MGTNDLVGYLWIVDLNCCYMFAIEYRNDKNVWYECYIGAIKYGNDLDFGMIAICLQLYMGMIMIFKWFQYAGH